MMKSKFMILSAIAVALLGCGGGEGETGDVEAAKRAAAEVPKSADQLPSNMPPEARRAAEGAIGQQKAMQDMMNQRNEAMKKSSANGGR